MCEFKYPKIDGTKTGENIRRICKEKGFTVYDVQYALYVGSNQAVYNWLNGRSLPSIETFNALATLLGVTMEELIVLEEN